MTTTFIGVDLAWQGRTNHSGVVVARSNDRGATLAEVSTGLTSFEQVAQFIDAHATENTVVAIDAPLVIKNVAGRRFCERLVSRKFGARHASAHSSNLTLYPGGGPAQVVSLLAACGFKHDIDMASARERSGKWLFEVYPHPAQVVLFGLEKIIRYKKGLTTQRREGLATLRRYFLDVLSTATPPLNPGAEGAKLADTNVQELRGKALKQYEDLLDAWFCSYLALYLWWWGGERNEMLGDLNDGYIVVPTEPLLKFT